VDEHVYECEHEYGDVHVPRLTFTLTADEQRSSRHS